MRDYSFTERKASRSESRKRHQEFTSHMTEVTFFRRCPSCGRRFSVRLVQKIRSSQRRDTYLTRVAGATSRSRMATVSGQGHFKSDNQLAWDGYTDVTAKVRIAIVQDEFQLTFECKHCGHEWIEKRSIEAQPQISRRRD